ncbi:MAG: hypothetical protein ACI82S_001501 [Patiriisocius sp.]|jgi:hypothetical protein
MKINYLVIIAIFVLLSSGCVNMPPAHDYSQFRDSDPRSILILPPTNQSTEVIAPYSVMAQLSAPIAESGFYVFPVALVNQTFRNNGLTVANDVQAVPVAKLYEIFGADAALYIDIQEYGTSYNIISSDTVVTVSAKLVDLKSGVLLWQGMSSASSAESRGNSGGGLVGMLVEAAVYQIIETVGDTGFDVSAIASTRLVSSQMHNGLLHGPRSPKYGQPATSEKK